MFLCLHICSFLTELHCITVVTKIGLRPFEFVYININDASLCLMILLWVYLIYICVYL